ncbi:MAG: LPS assembly protein LptD [Pseudomonadota bacterium]
MVAATRRWLGRIWIGVATAIICASISIAQQQVVLLADRIDVSSDGTVITASGDVSVEYEGDKIETPIVRYDQTTGILSFPNGLVYTSDTGEVLSSSKAVVADDLDSGDFQDVTFQITKQFRILSDQLVTRDDGSATLSNSIATSCEVCAANPVPFWQIRALSIDRNPEQNRLYFEHAVFEFLGIPVFYAPRLSTPEPGVARASGFLIPQFKTTNTVGFGVTTPYYYVINDHSDATLLPFFSTAQTFILEGEYRKLYKNGVIVADGAIALIDPLSNKDFRSFGSVVGQFDLKRDFKLSFFGIASSDDDFRQDYGFGDEDRLNSFATISKTTASRYFETSASFTQSLREDDDSSEIPFVFPEIYFTQIGNVSSWSYRADLQTLSLLRDTDQTTLRAGGRLQIGRSFVTKTGVETMIEARLDGSVYDTENSPVIEDGRYSFIAPTLAATFRYPLTKTHQNGGRSLLQPVAQFIWAEDTQDTVPNEDSVQLEFEDSNLFSLNRFPGFDAVELGPRANIGVSYLYQDPNDWRFGLTLGQVFRAETSDQFSAAFASGLSGKYSDTVIALTFNYRENLAVTNRTLVGRNFEISKFETQLAYTAKNWNLALEYIFLEDDVVIGSNETQNQAGLLIGYQASRNWRLTADIRQDFEANTPIEQFFGAKYQNECIALDFGFLFDYATGTGVATEREFGLTIELLGFGGDTSDERRAQSC